MTADSLDSLLQTLTGFPQASLQVLQTEEFGMPRYDVAWTASGDSGMESCRAAILDDGMYYYVLTSSVNQEQTAQNRETLDQVFATLGLYADEGFWYPYTSGKPCKWPGSHRDAVGVPKQAVGWRSYTHMTPGKAGRFLIR